jgi:hypothetical protein
MNNYATQDLLQYRSNIYSQNGEDGILDFIFRKIGKGAAVCCEFGAWDGLHLSNCRKLILEGWRCVMIEGELDRYEKLRANYAGNPNVYPVNCFVDNGDNSVDMIMSRLGIVELDLLSIDIDGLDYDVMSSLRIKPRVICVEVNAGHKPDDSRVLPSDIAKHNVGQPLGAFVRKAEELGYGLLAYNGNAFFLRNDCMRAAGWSAMTSVQGYDAFIAATNPAERSWLYLVNIGAVPPFHRYNNERLAASALGISSGMALLLRLRARVFIFLRWLKRAFRAG